MEMLEKPLEHSPCRFSNPVLLKTRSEYGKEPEEQAVFTFVCSVPVMRSFRAGEYFGKWLFKRELNTFAELKTAKPYFNHAPNTLKKNSVNYPIKNFLMSKWLTPVVLAAIEDIK